MKTLLALLIAVLWAWAWSLGQEAVVVGALSFFIIKIYWNEV